MAQTVNLFKSKLFSSTTLTNSINLLPEVPQQVGTLKLFDEKGIPTTSAWVERKGQMLRLVPAAARGATGQEYTKIMRDGISLDSMTLPQTATIYADELQDVMKFASEGQQLESLKEVIEERLAAMARDMDATHEHHKLGTLKGLILDADGVTVLSDMYDRFDIDAYETMEFDFATAAEGDFRDLFCTEVIRRMRDELQVKIDVVRCFCGKNFFNSICRLKEVREGYNRFREGERLRDRTAFVPWDYGGVIFEEYSGQAGGAPFVHPDEAHFFPQVSGLFQLRWTPAPLFSAINKPGIPRYVRTTMDPADNPAWIKLDVSSHPIYFCQCPKSLIKAKRKT